METKITLYVIRCKTRDHYYVGTTLRPLCIRIREHAEENMGSLWTSIHGFDRVEEAYVVPNHRASHRVHAPVRVPQRAGRGLHVRQKRREHVVAPARVSRDCGARQHVYFDT